MHGGTAVKHQEPKKDYPPPANESERPLLRCLPAAVVGVVDGDRPWSASGLPASMYDVDILSAAAPLQPQAISPAPFHPEPDDVPMEYASPVPSPSPDAAPSPELPLVPSPSPSPIELEPSPIPSPSPDESPPPPEPLILEPSPAPEEPEPEVQHPDEGHHPQFDEPRRSDPLWSGDEYYCDTHTADENKCCGMGFSPEDAETCVHYCDTHTAEEEPCCDCCPAPNGQPARYGEIASCRVENGGEEALLMSPPPPRSPPPPPSLPPLRKIIDDRRGSSEASPSPSPSAEAALDAFTAAADARAADGIDANAVTASAWDSGRPRFAEVSLDYRMREPLQESRPEGRPSPAEARPRPEPWRTLQPQPQQTWDRARPWDSGDARPPHAQARGAAVNWRQEQEASSSSRREPWPAWWAKSRAAR